MNEFVYIAHITKSHGGLHFYGVRYDFSMWRRLWQPLSVHIRSHPPTRLTQDHNTGNCVPYSCEQCVGSLTSHKVIINKGCETGPTIYRPYPRRLERLTICRCHYKGSTFSSVNLKILSVGPARVWTRDLPVLYQLSHPFTFDKDKKEA